MKPITLTPAQEKVQSALPLASISTIATLIYNDWKNIYFGAKPYLEAMMSLESIRDNYINDSGKSIVIYFLGNAQTWRGPMARIIKAELNRRIKGLTN